MPALAGGAGPVLGTPGMGSAATTGPAAGSAAAGVNAQQAAGPGQGGAATAEVAQQQLPGAQAAAGMPMPAPGGAGGDPNQLDPSQLAPGAAPAMAPGFAPNSSGMQVYPQGQGPITEQVLPMHEMGPITPQNPLINPPKFASRAPRGNGLILQAFEDARTDPQTWTGSPEEFVRRKVADGAGVSAGPLLSLDLVAEVARLGVKEGSVGEDGYFGPSLSGDYGDFGALHRTSPLKLTLRKRGADSPATESLRKDANVPSTLPSRLAGAAGAAGGAVVPLALGSALGGVAGAATSPGSRFEGAGRGMAIGAGTTGGILGGGAIGGLLGRLAAKGLKIDPNTASALGKLVGATGGGVAGYSVSKDVFGKEKEAKIMGSHGVPLVSTEGGMQRSTAGDGDYSSLKLAPWAVQGADAFDSVNLHPGTPKAKGNTSFGKMASDDSIGVIVIQQDTMSSFARGFVKRCREEGWDDEMVVKMAEVACAFDPIVADEMDCIVKQAGPKQWLTQKALPFVGGKLKSLAPKMFGAGKTVAPKVGPAAAGGGAKTVARQPLMSAGERLAAQMGQKTAPQAIKATAGTRAARTAQEASKRLASPAGYATPRVPPPGRGLLGRVLAPPSGGIPPSGALSRAGDVAKRVWRSPVGKSQPVRWGTAGYGLGTGVDVASYGGRRMYDPEAEFSNEYGRMFGVGGLLGGGVARAGRGPMNLARGRAWGAGAKKPATTLGTALGMGTTSVGYGLGEQLGRPLTGDWYPKAEVDQALVNIVDPVNAETNKMGMGDLVTMNPETGMPELDQEKWQGIVQAGQGNPVASQEGLKQLVMNADPEMQQHIMGVIQDPEVQAKLQEMGLDLGGGGGGGLPEMFQGMIQGFNEMPWPAKALVIGGIVAGLGGMMSGNTGLGLGAGLAMIGLGMFGGKIPGMGDYLGGGGVGGLPSFEEVAAKFPEVGLTQEEYQALAQMLEQQGIEPDAIQAGMEQMTGSTMLEMLHSLGIREATPAGPPPA